MDKNVFFENEKIKPYLRQRDFGSAAKVLLEDQKLQWPQLAEGYASLDTVETKTINFDGFVLKVQFNPGRIVSSSAKVDAKSIKDRKCFLCVENLPPEQKGIPYKNDYLILCNPFPIFKEHFTIPNLKHIPQRIDHSFGRMLMLSKDLSSNYTLFYNGPKCGASAPDHLHFQAGSKFFMPLDSEFDSIKKQYGKVLFDRENLAVYAVDDGLRRFISFEGSDYRSMKIALQKMYSFYSSITRYDHEPMMNIIAFFEEGKGWRILVFLRNKHRSSHYFADGEDNLLLSPASVDLGGVCITPLEKDFIKADKKILTEVFHEIRIGKEAFDFISLSLNKKL